MDRIKEKISNLEEKRNKSERVDGNFLQKCGLKNITLRDYQEIGVQWLVDRYKRSHGAILGDEMGLGKTCQTISMLVYFHGSGESKGPFLILSPLSVMANWQNELARFAPDLNVTVYTGSKEAREELRNKIRKDKNEITVLLTTYEMCLKDERFLRKFAWHTLVVDEAHRLKNRESLLHQALLDFNINHRVLLTGTPVQNNLKELYSLLCFVAPNVFKEKYMSEFVDHYSDLQDKKDTKELHELLKPFLLRRIKSEVVKDLPKKSEVVLFHGMTALQKKYYKAILVKDTSVFETGHTASRTQIMNILMQLRKCVNHPYLFDGVEPEPFQLGEHLVEASGKLVVIDQLLDYLQPRGHKVLLFSQMTRMLDIIQDYLGYRGYSYERLDGSVRGEERYLAIKNFNQDDDTFIFLLSTRAGGQGLNLVAADTIIFVDSDFNPQNDLQAAARAHRIGQTRPVKVIRLIGQSTVEEIILRRAEAKLELTNTVIEGGQFSSVGTSKEDGERLIADSNVQLRDILKFGLDNLLSDEASSVEDVDFEKILGKSKDKEWVAEEEQSKAQASLAEASMEVDEGIGDSAAGASMYMFEGTDYSKEPTADDEKVLQDIIDAEKALKEAAIDEGRTKRTKKAALLPGILPETSRKPRGKLTAEQLEERRKKREELAAQKAKEAEEAAYKKAQQKKKKLEALWESNNYISLNIKNPKDKEGESSDSEDDDHEENEEENDGGDGGGGLHYVVGDVTKPQNVGEGDAIILHCVDDSGNWGSGGVFSALSRRSEEPEKHYEFAYKMKDLYLGDAHLVPFNDSQDRDKGKDYCVLCVAQHRDRRNNLSGIHLTSLQESLQKVHHAAKQHAASVHLARIGHNTPNFNWYGTERLLRKELAAKGVPTYIYYFKRRAPVKRAITPDSDSDSDAATPATKMRRESSPKPGTSTTPTNKPKQSKAALMPLPNFMRGVVVFFHDDLKEAAKAKLNKYLIAFDGEVSKTVDEETTHIVAPNDFTDMQSIQDLCQQNKSVIPVCTKWLQDCFSKLTKVNAEKYRLDQ